MLPFNTRSRTKNASAPLLLYHVLYVLDSAAIYLQAFHTSLSWLTAGRCSYTAIERAHGGQSMQVQVHDIAYSMLHEILCPHSCWCSPAVTCRQTGLVQMLHSPAATPAPQRDNPPPVCHQLPCQLPQAGLAGAQEQPRWD